MSEQQSNFNKLEKGLKDNIEMTGKLVELIQTLQDHVAEYQEEDMSYKKKVHKAIQDLYIQTKPLRIGRAVMMDEKLKAGIAGMLFTLIAGIVIYVVMDNWETITTFTLDYQMPIWGQILLVAISVITTNLGTWHFSKRRKEQ